MYRSFVGHVSLALVLLLSALLPSEIYTQAPQGINYQAVARSADGEPLADTTFLLTFTIAQDVNLTSQDYV